MNEHEKVKLSYAVVGLLMVVHVVLVLGYGAASCIGASSIRRQNLAVFWFGAYLVFSFVNFLLRVGSTSDAGVVYLSRAILLDVIVGNTMAVLLS